MYHYRLGNTLLRQLGWADTQEPTQDLAVRYQALGVVIDKSNVRRIIETSPEAPKIKAKTRHGSSPATRERVTTVDSQQ